MAQDPVHIQFICLINDDQYEEIIPCNKNNNYIVHQEDKDILWKLKNIVTHEEPNISYHPNYKLSWYNGMV